MTAFFLCVVYCRTGLRRSGRVSREPACAYATPRKAGLRGRGGCCGPSGLGGPVRRTTGTTKTEDQRTGSWTKSSDTPPSCRRPRPAFHPALAETARPGLVRAKGSTPAVSGYRRVGCARRRSSQPLRSVQPAERWPFAEDLQLTSSRSAGRHALERGRSAGASVGAASALAQRQRGAADGVGAQRHERRVLSARRSTFFGRPRGWDQRIDFRATFSVCR
jgi:hypothetical protein